MCREFEQLLQKQRRANEPMYSMAIDLHVRTCLACRRTYQQEGQLRPASASITASIRIPERTKATLRIAGVTALTIAAALFMVRHFSATQATKIVDVPAASKQVALKIQEAVSAAEETVKAIETAETAKTPDPEPPPAPGVRVSIRPKTTLYSSPKHVAVSAEAPFSKPAVRPEPFAPPQHTRQTDLTLKYAMIQNAGPEPVLVAVTRPEFVSEPLSAEAGGAKPKFAVISGAGPAPVLIEVAPYPALNGTHEIANTLPPAATEPKRSVIISGGAED
jgi:hypothetical protein